MNPPARSLRVALINAAVFGSLTLLGYFAADSAILSVLLYIVLAIACPIGGMILTVIEAQENVARDASRLAVGSALLIAAAILIIGGRWLALHD